MQPRTLKHILSICPELTLCCRYNRVLLQVEGASGSAKLELDTWLEFHRLALHILLNLTFNLRSADDRSAQHELKLQHVVCFIFDLGWEERRGKPWLDGLHKWCHVHCGGRSQTICWSLFDNIQLHAAAICSDDPKHSLLSEPCKIHSVGV